MHHFLQIWFDWVQHWGYLGVIVLMAMESSIFPVPSEVVIPPAAFMATQPGSGMTLIGVIIAGTFGSWLGAAITYWASLWLGRLLILKWGKIFLINEEKLDRAERWVHRYEAGGIFFARLLPVIRHLISIPAGIIRMNFAMFSLMTVVGSAIWCSVLAWLGQKIAHDNPAALSNPDALVHAVKSQSHLILGFIAVFCVLYFLVMRLTAKKTPALGDAVR